MDNEPVPAVSLVKNGRICDQRFLVEHATIPYRVPQSLIVIGLLLRQDGFGKMLRPSAS